MFLKHKKVVSSLLIIVMVLSMLVVPVQADAASYSANSLLDLAKIVRVRAMARDSDFTVAFNGSDSELNSLFAEHTDFFYYTLVSKELDDASTTDDADYLVGNIDFSKDTVSTDGDNNIRFTFTYFEASDETQYVNTKTNEILGQLGVAQMSNYEKVKTIHDYVCNLISYKDDVDYSSAYAAYTTGYGLCNSYAMCMYKLLTTAGVPCKWIGGTAGTGRDAGGHAWNIVELGNKWYALDATWDDAEDQLSYDYFLKGTSDFDEADSSQTHTMDTEYTESNYLNMFPISADAFSPENDSDTNTDSVTSNVDDITGNTIVPTTPVVPTTPTTNTVVNTVQPLGYNFADVISKTKPSTKKTLTMKKKKSASIYVYLKNKKAMDRVYNFSYKVTKGKNKVKVKKYNYVFQSGKQYFLKLKVTGKKKGSSAIKVTVTLENGQKKSYTFKTKVK